MPTPEELDAKKKEEEEAARAAEEDKHKGLRGQPESEYIRMIEELRRENSQRRKVSEDLDKRLAAIEDEKRKQTEAKLAEEGKFKELLSEKEKRIADLAALEQEVLEHRQFFQAELDAKLKGLTDVQKELVEAANLSLAKKVEMANRLLAEKPGSNSPGGKPGKQTLTEAQLEDVLKPENWRQLSELSVKNPELYKKAIELRNRKKSVA